MDRRSRCSIEAAQGDSFLSAHPCSTRAWRAPVNLHGGNKPGYQHRRPGYEHGVQRPVYYVREVLTESKQRYPHYQKIAYGVFLASRKLRHYFQEHPITVV